MTANHWQNSGLRARARAVKWKIAGLLARVRSVVLPIAAPGDHGMSRRAYAAWLRRWEPDAAQLLRLRQGRDCDAGTSLISILMPVFNPRPAHLREAIESVVQQTYPHWQLCICDDASSDPEIHRVIERFAAADTRISVFRRDRNGGITAATADALQLARADTIAFLDHDDRLPPWALHRVAVELVRHPQAELLYSDEDKLDSRGRRFAPHLKSGWNPDLLDANNYIGHLLVIKRALIERAGGLRPGFDGSQDYDLLLRCTRQTTPEQIRHIEAILYHWRAAAGSTARRPQAKPYAHDAGLSALQQAYGAQPGVRIEGGIFATSYRVRWPLPETAPEVAILIPTRDGASQLKRCVDSIVARTAYPRYRVLVIDNQSADPATLAYLDELQAAGRAQVLRYDRPFNYSAINNFAAAQAQAELLLLLNDDVEVHNADWLSEMVSRLLQPGVGAVGAKLYYPGGRVQHAGIVLGIGGVAGHSHKYYRPGHRGYFGRLMLPQTVSAVTGACLLVRRGVFQSLGGLNERDLPVAFNDVDFCLRLGREGLRCVWTPFAELTHYESLSRGAEDTPEKQARFSREVQYMHSQWAGSLAADPYYNARLSLKREDFSLNSEPRPLAQDFFVAPFLDKPAADGPVQRAKSVLRRWLGREAAVPRRSVTVSASSPPASVAAPPLSNDGLLILNPDNPVAPRRTLIVLGLARSGTTMVASALHHLGVPMCDRPNIVYEDSALSEAMESGDDDRLQQLIEQKNRAHAVWGWKRPSSIEHGAKLERMCRNAEYIVVFRDILAVANRNRIAVGSDLLGNMEESVRQYATLIEFLRMTQRRALLISYEKAIQQPKEFVKALADFVQISDIRLHAAAIAVVQPNHEAYMDLSRSWVWRGRVEQLSAARVTGWAFYQGRDEPVTIEVAVNGRPVADGRADIPRSDLLGRHASGRCGYEIDLPRLRQWDVVTVRIAGERRDLHGSPCIYREPPSGPAVPRPGAAQMDALRADCISGWARISGTAEPAIVTVLVNGRIIQSVRASGLRKNDQDGAPAPDGAGGFSVELSGNRMLRKGDIVSIRVAAAGREFGLQPRAFR